MRAYHSTARLGLAFLLWFSWAEDQRAHGADVNVTVDDSDPSVQYRPSASWQENPAACTACLNVDLSTAFQNTYHQGTHLLSSGASTPSPTSGSGGSGSSGGGSNGGGSGQGDDDEDSKLKRRTSRAFAKLRDDSDEPLIPDPPVTAQFKFNGTAVYLYCIQPVGSTTATKPLTTINLSFTLDNNAFPSYFHSASDSSSGFANNVNVFAQENLTPAPHVLLVSLGQNSTFLFDYMKYTQPPVLASNSSSTSSNSRKNIATYGGAVGGSVGLLGVLALCLFISIYRRRLRAARRDRAANGTDTSPQMIGPRPFIPRYFPGTNPPPYTPSASSPHSSSSSYHDFGATPSNAAPAYPSRPAQHLSYADVPPSTPPPHDDSAPPPFGVAVASAGTTDRRLPASSQPVTDLSSPSLLQLPQTPLLSDIQDADSLLPRDRPQSPTNGASRRLEQVADR